MPMHKFKLWGGTALHYDHNGWLSCRYRSSIVKMEPCCSGAARLFPAPRKSVVLLRWMHHNRQIPWAGKLSRGRCTTEWWKLNFLCNLGYGDPHNLDPRSPPAHI
jgi:hypothetical protein